jgi:hypothetical protein
VGLFQNGCDKKPAAERQPVFVNSRITLIRYPFVPWSWATVTEVLVVLEIGVAVAGARGVVVAVQVTPMVYTRPEPRPERSARSWSVVGLVTIQSGAVFPSPRPLIGSLLLTESVHTGAVTQLPVTA